MTAPPIPPPPAPPPAELLPFRYDAQTLDGRTFRGTLEAASLADAQDRLTHLQLRILSLEAAPPASPRARRTLGRGDFLLFNQQLAYLTAAGLPVERGLRLIAADLRSGRLSRAAAAVARDLESGASLQDAFTRHARNFPPLYARLVEAGVQAGNLPAMLFNLGRHLELVSRLRQSLWRVLSYPLMVAFAGALVFYFIATQVLPQFAEMYRDFKTPLPALTEFVLGLGPLYPPLFFTVLGTLALIILAWSGLRLLGYGGAFLDTVLIHLPLVGPVIRASLISRWVDALRLAVEAGLDLPRAIALASDAAASPRLARDSAALSAVIAGGRKISEFRGRLLPETVPTALELGAAAGNLPGTLATLSSLYEQQAEHRLRAIPTIMTPLLMVLIAAVIATGIAALFLPLIKLIQSVSGEG